MISIGPLHHDDPTLLESEKLKLKLAEIFVKNIGVDRDTLYNNMTTEIDGLKKCYYPKLLEESNHGKKFMEAIIRFIDSTVKDPQSHQQDSWLPNNTDFALVNGGSR
ncbi:Zinc finger FYVE domain-containing 26 [Gossypium arboreum]|uniref:Zinc finger FYVE domain-containing 26 n=1 Tax=Gossypium arboreum TaxID=29729 RepID=A0A0B0MSA5_GOSAR|nr:Zinc finger FYVE domain-containing 26 [Gossypium arboreum]